MDHPETPTPAAAWPMRVPVGRVVAASVVRPQAGSPAILVIALGGTGHRAALVQDGRVVEARRLRLRRFDGPWSDAVVRLAEEWQGRFEAVAVTGPPGSADLSELERQLGRPVTALAPALAAGWAEHRFGAGRGRDMVYVDVGGEVAGVLVLGNRIAPGRDGRAGRIGRMRVPGPGGPRVLDDVASFTALSARATQHGARDAAALASAAGLGAGWATALLDEAAAALAFALQSIQALLAPDVTVLAGPLGAATGFVERVEAKLADPLVRPGERPVVVRAALGEEAAVLGAADHLACTTRDLVLA